MTAEDIIMKFFKWTDKEEFLKAHSKISTQESVDMSKQGYYNDLKAVAALALEMKERESIDKLREAVDLIKHLPETNLKNMVLEILDKYLDDKK